MTSRSEPLLTHCRWRICALLFFATTINYIDRQVFSLLAPDLQRSIGWTESQYPSLWMARRVCGNELIQYNVVNLLGYLLPEAGKSSLLFRRRARDDPKRSARYGEVPSWRAIITFPQTWAYILAKFLTDPIWGWLSSHLIKRGWSVNRARKTALLVCALCVTPIVTMSRSGDVWYAEAVLSLAAAHQGWSANLMTLTSDMFPQNAVGTVVSLGGAGGSVGRMALAASAGFILQYTGSYMPLFFVAGTFYLIAFGVLQLLAPRLEPVSGVNEG